MELSVYEMYPIDEEYTVRERDNIVTYGIFKTKGVSGKYHDCHVKRRFFSLSGFSISASLPQFFLTNCSISSKDFLVSLANTIVRSKRAPF